MMSRRLETINGHMFDAVAAHSDPNVPSCGANRFVVTSWKRTEYLQLLMAKSSVIVSLH